MMKQFTRLKVKTKTMWFRTVFTMNGEAIIKVCVMLNMVSMCVGAARQYEQSRNDLFTRPEGGLNRRHGGRMKLLTPDASNADVLKELGVDLSNEGKFSSKSLITNNMLIQFLRNKASYTLNDNIIFLHICCIICV